MARLVTCGYETGDVLEQGATTTGVNNTLTVVSSTPTPRLGGNWCLKALVSNTGSIGAYKTFAFGSNLTDVWVRFGLFLHLGTSTAEIAVCQIFDSAAALQANVGYNPSTSQFVARRGAVGSGTSLATSATSGGYPQDAWHLFEVRYQVTSTTVGVMEVWLNGVQVINFSGDNTNTANVNAASVAIGAASSGSVGFAGAYVGIDDIAINDTSGSLNNGRPGDGRVIYLVPTGAGSSTGLSRGGTDSGANWSQVEETPPSMTDYVWSATVAARDLYAITDAPTGTLSIAVVELVAYAVNSDAGAGSLGLTLKSGATTNEATSQALSSGVGYYRARYETDPNTSAAWTLSALQAIEAGVTVR